MKLKSFELMVPGKPNEGITINPTENNGEVIYDIKLADGGTFMIGYTDGKGWELIGKSDYDAEPALIKKIGEKIDEHYRAHAD